MNSRTYKLGLLKVPVSDIEISSKFYEMDLGFEIDFVAPEYKWAQMKTGEISVALYTPGKGGGERKIGGSVDFHLILEGKEFDELAQKMKAEQKLSGGMIHQGADGTTFIDILDPDENLIKVFRK